MTAHQLDVYSFPNYIAYVLYPPLYIAGPIMTFNDFMWQVYLVCFCWNNQGLTYYLSTYDQPRLKIRAPLLHHISSGLLHAS